VLVFALDVVNEQSVKCNSLAKEYVLQRQWFGNRYRIILLYITQLSIMSLTFRMGNNLYILQPKRTS